MLTSSCDSSDDNSNADNPSAGGSLVVARMYRDRSVQDLGSNNRHCTSMDRCWDCELVLAAD